MKLFRVCALLVLAGAVSCKNDTTGSVSVLPPLAGLRYMNMLPDTAGLDFRIIDAVAYAPNQTAATFRTGGLVYGISTGTDLPYYSPVAAGQHVITVFLNGTTAATASIEIFKDTVTFTQGINYTFYLYGVSGNRRALVTADTVPTIASNKLAVRVLNLAAPDLAGNIAGSAVTSVDARVGLANSAVPIPVTAGIPAIAVAVTPGNFSSYVIIDTSGTTVAYRLAVTATGTTTPVLFQAALPIGSRGVATANPVPGSAVGGTAITAVIVPRSVPGSVAPQTTPAAVIANIDSVTRSNDTVTVWRHITPGNGTTTCNSAVAAGAAANGILNISGLIQPEYNGSVSISTITAGVSQTLDTARQTVTLTGGTAGSTFRLTFSAQQTAAIAFDETAASLQTALGALSSIGGAANVGVTGPAGGPYVVVFKGTFLGTNPVPAMTVSVAGTVTGTVATNFNCLGAATSSRFRYRIAGTPASPATGAMSYKTITPTNDFASPNIVFIVDQLPPRTAP